MLPSLRPYLGNALHDPVLLCPPLGYDDEALIAEHTNVPGAVGLRSTPHVEPNTAEVCRHHLICLHHLHFMGPGFLGARCHATLIFSKPTMFRSQQDH